MPAVMIQVGEGSLTGEGKIMGNKKRVEHGLDRFFRELFGGLRPLLCWPHPSRRTLRAYLARRPPSDLLLPEAPEELLKWSDERIETAYHLLTCPRCARRLVKLRQTARQPLSAKRQTGWHSSRLVGYGVLATLLLAIIWTSIPTPSPPPPTHPPSSTPSAPVSGGLGGG